MSRPKKVYVRQLGETNELEYFVTGEVHSLSRGAEYYLARLEYGSPTRLCKAVQAGSILFTAGEFLRGSNH